MGTAPGYARAPWLDRANLAWSYGQREEALAQWLNGLRSNPPTDLALLVAQRQTLAQINALHARWSGRMPMVILRENNAEPSQWMALALPTTGDLNRALEELRYAYGATVQWGSVIHWLATLPQPGTGQSPSMAAAAPTTPQPADQATTARNTPNPVAQTASASLPVAPAPSAPATRVAPPELTRSAALPVGDTRSAPTAARVIEVEFDAVEQQLAKGQHDTALDGLEKLERAVGVNWRTRYLSGVALSSLGRWPEAVAALASAHTKNPGHARVSLYLSVAQQETGGHAAAMETLNNALQKHPDQPELWLNQGHSLQALGRSEEAQIAYWRFMDLSAKRPDLAAQRAWVQSRTTKVN